MKQQASPLAPLVLIVDDSEDTLELYAEFFRRAGLRVALAVDGDHALLKAMTMKPDLIVTDLSMPVLDGWSTIRELKARPKMAHIPVIALTAHVARKDLRRARDAGADAVLTKPCEPASLLEVGRRLLASR